MIFFEFVFQSFWHFLGFVALSGLVLECLRLFFNFIVELIHGKPVIQNLKIPIDKMEEIKDLSKEKEDNKKAKDPNDNGFDAGLSMNIGKVEVIKKDKK